MVEQAVRILRESVALHGGLPQNSRSAEFVYLLRRFESAKKEKRGKRIKFRVRLRRDICNSFDVEWVCAVRIVSAVFAKFFQTAGGRRNARG